MMARALTEYCGSFFMLGIIHRDTRNDAVLRRWMDRIKPDVITLEVSRYSLDFRRQNGQAYRRKLDDILRGGLDGARSDFDDFYSFVDMPCEFAVAREYCTENKIDVYPVDMDLFSFLKLRKIDEMIDRENMRKSLAGDHSKTGSFEQALADLYFHKGVTAFSYDEEMAMRDRFMCHRIDILRKRHKNGRFLHIAGWQHLRDPLSLYDIFQPVKIFPYD